MPGDPENVVSRLFDEYVDAREADERPDRGSYAERAGAEKEELLERIEAYETIEDMAAGLDNRPLERSFGRYEIRSLIGSGGLGEVYLARDPTLDRDVALKVLDRGRVGLEESRIALNEARALARLEHQGVVRVFEVGEVDGRAYIAMEHLASPSLSQVLAELRRLARGRQAGEGATELVVLARRLESMQERTRVLQELASALAYCHDRGVVHRDVKPSNVLLAPGGRPVLIDFGLAHVENSGEEARADFTQRFVGTPAYAAPEQVAAQRTGDDPRSDQFSFGSLAYELYSLANPFQRDTQTSTLDAVALSDPARLGKAAPAVSRDAERVVHHCLERDPNARYPDMAAVAGDLQAILGHVPIALAEPSLAHALNLWTRRHKRSIVTLASFTLLALLSVLSLSWTDAKREQARILREISSIGAETLEDPNEFEARYEQLKLAQDDAARNARRALVLGPGVVPSVESAVVAWSERLAHVITREMASSEQEGLTFQHGVWARLVEFERSLCPDCTANLEFRNRSVVRLPEEVNELEYGFYEQSPLAPQEHLAMTLVHRQAPYVERPVIGSYRLLFWRPDEPAEVAYEIDFLVTSPWAEETQLVLSPRRAEFWDPSLPFPSRRFAVNAGAYPVPGEPSDIRLPAFNITAQLVTREQFEVFLRETGRSDDYPYSPQPLADSPAWVLQEEAQAFCCWAGGRLPTTFELIVAHEAGAIGSLEASDAGFGEWIGDQVFFSNEFEPSYFSYVAFATYAKAMEREWSPPVWPKAMPGVDRPAHNVPGGHTVGVAFRVAFTADTNLDYHHE